ncbi:kinetoplast-associated protein KAP [Ophiocordyceps camponoti-floridani]|uniref:Kinetoplast-associated protein KAP n=1 Tax=Ophiocordyceps camponoti-floridani TaxID=2030778 RepID=A0A8H4Q4R9_9HYPO|nr:kinetoplast-associated protein KAP [Ophiocordyceps camponoti-floridani]
MPPNRTPIQPGVESSRSTSHPSEEEDSYQFDENNITDEEPEYEGDDYGLSPSDSASAVNERPPSRPRSGRSAARRQRISRQEAQYAPLNSPSVESPDDFGGGYYGQSFQSVPPPRGGGGGGGGGYYNGRGHTSLPGYNHASHYMTGFHAGGQMVPYNFGPNPFTPMSNHPSGASYFGAEPRPLYDVMPYQHNYYNPQQYLAPHMQQLSMAPGPAPATDVAPAKPASPAPPKEPPVDIEKIKRDAEEAARKLQEDRQKAINDQLEREAQIRKDAEESFQKRLEDARKQHEDAQKEIARAKAEADRAAVERIQAEKKAEEERSRLQAEEMKRAEEKAIREYEAKAKAEEEKKKRELEERIRIEEAAKAQVHAILKAEAEAKAAAEKKAAEDADRLKLIQEEAKLKAEIEAKAKVEAEKEAAKKAAEDEAAAKKEQEAMKKRIVDEAKAKFMEEASKNTEKGIINFKDAVGRKFNFPFALVKTWPGMEELIKQAFLHVEIIGPHVQEGHYDLTGPNGEIILPSIWEKVIQPDWNISMTMWPVEKRPPLGGPKPLFRGRGGPAMPPPPPMGPPGMEPPPDWHPDRRRHSHMPNIEIVDMGPPPKSRKPTAKKKPAGVLNFFAATSKPPPKKKASSKK